MSYPEPPAQFGKASTSRKPAKPTTAKPTTAQADAAKSLQKASHKPTTPVTKPKVQTKCHMHKYLKTYRCKVLVYYDNK